MSNHPPTGSELLERVWEHSASVAAMCAEAKAAGGFKLESWSKMLDHTTKANAAMQELHNRLRGVPVATHKYNEPD